MSAASTLAASGSAPQSRGLGSRWIFSLAAAGGVTFALFALMQILVAADVMTVEEPAAGPPIVIRFDIPDIPPNRIRVLPEPEPVAPPPASPRIETSSEVPSLNPGVIPLPPGIDAGEVSTRVEVVLPPPPLEIRTPPAYPQRELDRGVQGACTVRYDILASGATANIQVLDCDSRGFAQASVAAVERWRHAARTGRAPNEVVVRGHVTTLDFTLD